MTTADDEERVCGSDVVCGAGHVIDPSQVRFDEQVNTDETVASLVHMTVQESPTLRDAQEGMEQPGTDKIGHVMAMQGATSVMLMKPCSVQVMLMLVPE